MENPTDAGNQVKERRRMSHAGVLESAIRMVAQLTSSTDVTTRSIANRALAELQKLRHDMPKRRQTDGKSLRRQPDSNSNK